MIKFNVAGAWPFCSPSSLLLQRQDMVTRWSSLAVGSFDVELVRIGYYPLIWQRFFSITLSTANQKIMELQMPIQHYLAVLRKFKY